MRSPPELLASVRRTLSASLTIIREALLDALAVLAPVECAGCGTVDRALCPVCRRQLAADVDTRRLRDGTLVFTGVRYQGVVQRTVLAFKRQGRTDVAHALAVPLAATVQAALLATGHDAVELVTVPSARAAFRRRGYDPVALLMRMASLPYAPRILAFARYHAQQKSLGRDARQQNLAGTMVARRSLGGRTFIIIDDVVTTGVTLEEAARAIQAAGGEVLCAVAMANTPRLRDRFAGSAPKFVTSPDDGTTVCTRGAQVNPGSAWSDAPR